MRTYEMFLDRGEAIHGHRCPSLAYGIRAAAILLGHLPPGVVPSRLVLRHLSGCFRDGVLATVESLLPADRIESIRAPGSCSVEASWDGGSLTVEVRPEVRAAVDAISTRTPDLSDYRREGLDFLAGLDDEEFARILSSG